MPSPTIPDGWAEVQIAIKNNFTPHVSAVSFASEVASTSQGISSWIDTMYAALPDLLQDMHNAYFSDGARLTFPTSDGTGSVEISWPDIISGGEGGDPADPRLCYVYNKRTAILGRHGRGRFFLPGVTENHVDGSGTIVDASFRTDMVNHAGSFMDKLTAPGGSLDPFNMYLIHAGGGGEVTEVFSLDPSVKAGIQRRRLA